MTRVRITLHRDGSRPAVLDLRDTDPVTTVHRGIITAGHLREGDRLAWGGSPTASGVSPAPPSSRR